MKFDPSRFAQAGLALAGAGLFLPWQTSAAAGAGSQNGLSLAAGPIVLIVCVVAIGLIQIRWRPAWIAAGFVAAVAAREILNLAGNTDLDPAAGVWISGAAGLFAALLLIWQMVAAVAERKADDPDR